ncbi:hypothetical protein SAMN05421553_3235 [Pseudomonas anguilliseptica]|uniref:Uncharacterized protein n=2 Tax=Pseudomonas anguilliseptica TaxID=53406 RepID=A0A1H5D5Z1_PSEAG|nr:hypothetical protein SAMN05421553_3235 [Pseudomonas anguilliseptica]
MMNHPFTGLTPQSEYRGAHSIPSKEMDQLTAPTVLTPSFASQLKAFNGLVRDMREAEMRIEALALLDNKIFIHADSVETMARRFAHEVRAQRSRAGDHKVRNVVTIRQIDVVWFTPLKEQDK